MPKQPAVHILTSKRNGTLYIGVSVNLVRRIWQHRAGQAHGFTSEYNVKRLVYFELNDDMERAILREKQLKRWRRAWKLELVEQRNPDWEDLWDSIIQ